MEQSYEALRENLRRRKKPKSSNYSGKFLSLPSEIVALRFLRIRPVILPMKPRSCLHSQPGGDERKLDPPFPPSYNSFLKMIVFHAIQLIQRSPQARLSQFDPYFQHFSRPCVSPSSLPLKKPAPVAQSTVSKGSTVSRKSAKKLAVRRRKLTNVNSQLQKILLSTSFLPKICFFFMLFWVNCRRTMAIILTISRKRFFQVVSPQF